MIVLVMPRIDYVPVSGRPNNWIGNGMSKTCSLTKFNLTVSTISKLLGAVAVSYAAQYLTMLAASASPQGVSSMAMQQGGLGLLMTLFLITVPPMAAAFFQGTIGQFMAYNAFGQGQAMQPGQGRPIYPVAPAPIESAGASSSTHQVPQRTVS